ncbi:MAG: TerB family tellurite resistance protein [Acidobacteriota bacterium]
MKPLLRSWLRVNEPDGSDQHRALRDLLDALDRMEPARARYLAQFAYLLGRVAHADQHVTPEETRTMEAIVQREGHLAADQAVLIIGLAQTSNRLFGGTDNYLVAREFAATASPEQRVDLLRCLFAVSATEGGISILEEQEIQRIARELRVEQPELVALRLEYRQLLPGVRRGES